jgi:hypothetical protein
VKALIVDDLVDIIPCTEKELVAIAISSMLWVQITKFARIILLYQYGI